MQIFLRLTTQNYCKCTIQQVKESVKEILHGGDAGQVAGRDFDKWHFEMFQPCITAGILKPSDLIGYRTEQVYIRGVLSP